MATSQSPETDERCERRRQLQNLREQLMMERAKWSRWMPRLKRAFHQIEHLDQRIVRLERSIAKLATTS